MDELICLSTDGLGKVGNCLILPPLQAGQTWGSLSLYKVFSDGDDKDDEAKMAINTLAAHLSEIVELTAHSNAAPGSIANSTGVADGFGIAKVALSTGPIPRKTIPSGADPPPKGTPNDCLCHRALLTKLGWDCTAKTLQLPVLTKNS